jgi:hypothetical protein
MEPARQIRRCSSAQNTHGSQTGSRTERSADFRYRLACAVRADQESTPPTRVFGRVGGQTG